MVIPCLCLFIALSSLFSELVGAKPLHLLTQTVLHTDLDGNCTALGGIQLQQLAHAKAGEVAQQVVQDDHGQDQQATIQIGRASCRERVSSTV